MVVVAMGLAWRLQSVKPRIVERIKYVQLPSAESHAAESPRARALPQYMLTSHAEQASFGDEPLRRNHYLQQRHLALSLGLDAFGESFTGDGVESWTVSSYRDLKTDYFEDDAARAGNTSAERRL